MTAPVMVQIFDDSYKVSSSVGAMTNRRQRHSVGIVGGSLPAGGSIGFGRSCDSGKGSMVASLPSQGQTAHAASGKLQRRLVLRKQLQLTRPASLAARRWLS